MVNGEQQYVLGVWMVNGEQCVLGEWMVNGEQCVLRVGMDCAW